MLRISIITLVITVLVNVLLALFVYLKNRKRTANVVFSFFAIGVAMWAFTNIITQLVTTVEAGLRWAELSNFSAVILAFFFVLFTIVFPNEKLSKKSFWFLLIIFLFGATITIWPGLLISNVELQPWHMEFNGYILLFTVWFLSMMIYGFLNIIRKYRKFSGQIKAQLRFILLGVAISTILGTMLNLGLPLSGRYEYVWLGPNFSLVMVAFIAYAIVVHRLMNIKMALRRYSVNFASLIFIITLAYLINTAIDFLLPDLDIITDYSIIIFGVLLFPLIQNYFFRIANRYFFSSLYDAREVISDLSEKLSSTLIVDKIYSYISQTIIDSLHVKNISFYIFNDNHKCYELKHSQGRAEKGPKKFVEDPGFYSRLLKKNKALVIEELKNIDYIRYRRTIEMLNSRKISIVIPLSVKNRVIGILTLSNKETNEVYNDEDIQLLEIISAQSAVAIENAINYEEIRNFSKKLEQEVESSTEELIRANSKLVQLDEAKSEFVSTASHQLRTPLTVIKGYIAMIMDGNFGWVNKTQRESLEKVFESNERLIQLVENLLNISRIESGRLKFNYEYVLIEELIRNITKMLAPSAGKRGLKLKYKPPKRQLPLVSVDQEKIRQVILNIVDNAIKYSPSGTIEISAEKQDNYIVCRIDDQGIGIERGDLGDLFEKFTRGSGTPLIDTEGTGLGLYVAERLVKAHGGRIWAESQGQGQGATFYFTIPVKKVRN